ncbi:hypothetical protein [Actinoplanes sp. NPDC049118]|uniref:hypothetical protein n=1 Tax=Actinoplanes sp. NPDC049118 TaxID=3155769 RepID=UPI0033E73391
MQPTWTVLLVAFLGVAGTLGATIFTQMWSARREDRRWRQEKEADERRWRREREDRSEQWQREDRLRTRQQRQEVYTGFLLAVATWASATYTVVVDRPESAGQLTSEELARLADLAEQAETSCVPLRLQGSPEVADASEEVCRIMLTFIKAIDGRSVDDQPVERTLETFRHATGLMLDRTRADLGIT